MSPTPISEVPAIQRKLIIVGDGACGKTSLLTVFERGIFPEVYTPIVAVGLSQTVTVDHNGKTREVELELTDTPGQEDYDRRPIRYAGCHVALVCFAIEWPYSLENAEEHWVNEVKHFCPDIPILLVGMKKDLREKFLTEQELAEINQHPVTFEEGQEIAQKIGAKHYLECSSKTGEGVAEVFQVSAKEALLYKNRMRNGRLPRCTIL